MDRGAERLRAHGLAEPGPCNGRLDQTSRTGDLRHAGRPRGCNGDPIDRIIAATALLLQGPMRLAENILHDLTGTHDQRQLPAILREQADIA